jgi:hypothetical protein
VGWESRPGCDAAFVKGVDGAEMLEARAVVVRKVEATVGNGLAPHRSGRGARSGTVRFGVGEDGPGGDGHDWRSYCEDKEIRHG